MPKQKDLKRLVRARMQKTGESYTAARLRIVNKKDFVALAWVRVLDTADAAKKSHRDIAKYVASLGTPSWWSQTVTVGYERIRGLRAVGQQRTGTYEANKSKTFAVPVDRLFKAFSDARLRAKWLPAKITIRTAQSNKSMRVTWDDETSVAIGFYPKGDEKSSVAVQHSKLPDKAAADRMKAMWAERFGALAKLLG